MTVELKSPLLLRFEINPAVILVLLHVHCCALFEKLVLESIVYLLVGFCFVLVSLVSFGASSYCFWCFVPIWWIKILPTTVYSLFSYCVVTPLYQVYTRISVSHSCVSQLYSICTSRKSGSSYSVVRLYHRKHNFYYVTSNVK